MRTHADLVDLIAALCSQFYVEMFCFIIVKSIFILRNFFMSQVKNPAWVY